MSFVTAERRRFIKDLGDLLLSFGMPAHSAYLYGYLLLRSEPASLDEISADLGLSKSQACVAAQVLEDTGNAKRSKEPGSKRIFYSAPDNYSRPFISQVELMTSVSKLLQERGPAVAVGDASMRLRELMDYVLAMRDAMDKVVRSFARANRRKRFRM
jgi:DNA-binding transcriptional regulator GbsR (MarR family)